MILQKQRREAAISSRNVFEEKISNVPAVVVIWGKNKGNTYNGEENIH